MVDEYVDGFELGGSLGDQIVRKRQKRHLKRVKVVLGEFRRHGRIPDGGLRVNTIDRLP